MYEALLQKFINVRLKSKEWLEAIYKNEIKNKRTNGPVNAHLLFDYNGHIRYIYIYIFSPRAGSEYPLGQFLFSKS